MPSPSAPRLQACLVSVGLVLLVGLVYGQTMRHDFLAYDDDLYITANAQVRAGLSLEGLRWAFQPGHASNWHPLTWLAHMLDCELWGASSRAHHAVNVAWQAVVALLAFLAFRDLTGSLGRAALFAALFVAHPLRVESVAWAAQRKDLMSLSLALVTIWCHGRFARHGGLAWYAATLASFALGLMSKPTLVPLPLLLLLLDAWPLGRRSRTRLSRLIVEKIPFLALAAGCSLLTLMAQKAGASVVALSQISFPLRLANATQSAALYLWKTVWPAHLAVFYPYPARLSPWVVSGSTAILASISALVIHRAKSTPVLAVGWFWYLIALVPVLGLVQVGEQAMADRYTALPHLGLFLLVAWGLPTPGPRMRRAVGCACVLVVAALAVRAHWQTAFWRNQESLFRHALAVTGDNGPARFHLANGLAHANRLVEAEDSYRRAIALDPRLAKAHLNLGWTLERQGRLAEARESYERTLAINPTETDALYNLGLLALRQGQPDRAIGFLQRLLRVAPSHASGQRNLERAMRLRAGRTAGLPAVEASSSKNSLPSPPPAMRSGDSARTGDARMKESH